MWLKKERMKGDGGGRRVPEVPGASAAAEGLQGQLMVLPTHPPLPTTSHQSREGVLLRRSLLWKNPSSSCHGI